MTKRELKRVATQAFKEAFEEHKQEIKVLHDDITKKMGIQHAATQKSLKRINDTLNTICLQMQQLESQGILT